MNATTILRDTRPLANVLSCAGTVIIHDGHLHECSDDPCCQVPAIAHEFSTHCDDESCCPA